MASELEAFFYGVIRDAPAAPVEPDTEEAAIQAAAAYLCAALREAGLAVVKQRPPKRALDATLMTDDDARAVYRAMIRAADLLKEEDERC